MALKPLKDRVVAVVEKPLEKTKSGILLGEAKEKPAYAVIPARTILRLSVSAETALPVPVMAAPPITAAVMINTSIPLTQPNKNTEINSSVHVSASMPQSRRSGNSA